MPRKSSLAVRRRRPSAKSDGKLRLRDEFRDYARVAILEAGEEILAHQGLYAARMEDVAQKARVAVGTIYNLVGDRDALVVEILRVRHEEIFALLTAKLEAVRGLPFREQALAYLVAVFGYFRVHWRFFRLVLESEGGGHKRLSHETLDGIRKLYRELIARGIDEHALRPQGRDLYPAMMMGMVRQVIIQDLENQHVGPPEERASQVLDVFLDGAATT